MHAEQIHGPLKVVGNVLWYRKVIPFRVTSEKYEINLNTISMLVSFNKYS